MIRAGHKKRLWRIAWLSALSAFATAPGAALAEMDRPAHEHHDASADAGTQDVPEGQEHAPTVPAAGRGHADMPVPTSASAPTPHPAEHSMGSMGSMGSMAPTPAAGDMTMGTSPEMDMRMQGGSAPPDARDPHAYSDGYTLENGAYALPGMRQLRMADEHRFGSLLVNRLEYVHSDGADSGAYDAQAWWGTTYDRLVLKGEGDYADGRLEDARTELLWGHAVSPYWDRQLGARYDGGEGPGRGWLALGLQGLSPYWFEVDATAYLGDEGRTALRLEAEYELLLSQRLILQPRTEANLYSRDDPERGIGSGLSDLSAGLRLRYEFSRQFAPYVGMEWSEKIGQTRDMAKAEGTAVDETRLVAGLRWWFAVH